MVITHGFAPGCESKPGLLFLSFSKCFRCLVKLKTVEFLHAFNKCGLSGRRSRGWKVDCSKLRGLGERECHNDNTDTKARSDTAEPHFHGLCLRENYLEDYTIRRRLCQI